MLSNLSEWLWATDRPFNDLNDGNFEFSDESEEFFGDIVFTNFYFKQEITTAYKDIQSTD
jgi:hypothetical protein